MRINNDGKIGIGIATAPAGRVDIRGGGSGIVPMINMYAGSGANDGPSIVWQTGDGSASIRAYRNETGGTSTQGPLIFQVYTDVGSQGTVDAMCIYGNGKVGIGTILPTATLHLDAANAMLKIEEIY